MTRKHMDKKLLPDTGKPMRRVNVRSLVLTSLLFAVALVLAMLENLLPPVPIPVPGVKFGLANIVVMYALFFLNWKRAAAIVGLKALFVASVRGVVSGLLSLSGGVLSLLVMMVLLGIFKDKISYLIVSIFGAIFHNIGQFVMISLLYTTLYLWVYLPVLILTGIAAGVLTSTLLRVIMPAFEKAGLMQNNNI